MGCYSARHRTCRSGSIPPDPPATASAVIPGEQIRVFPARAPGLVSWAGRPWPGRAAAPASLVYILIALAAFAMGRQANAIRSLNVPGISTTAFSATYVDLASGHNGPRHRNRLGRGEAA